MAFITTLPFPHVSRQIKMDRKRSIGNWKETKCGPARGTNGTDDKTTISLGNDKQIVGRKKKGV